VLFNRRKKLPLTIDPNDLAAIAHEKEVLAREEQESHASGETSIPTEIGFEKPASQSFRGLRSTGGNPAVKRFTFGNFGFIDDEDITQPPKDRD
jgi:hypothetical protein